MMLPQLILVDQNVSYAAGLQLLLHHEGYHIGAYTSDEVLAVLLAKIQRPDLIILECSAATGSSLETARRVKEQSPTSHIIIHAERPNMELLAWVLANNIAGLVRKTDRHQPLLQALAQTLATGNFYLQPHVTRDDLTSSNAPTLLLDDPQVPEEFQHGGFR
ncbi:MAG: hypothetical protein N2C14_24680 [Planctomycetales bacterium]